MDNCIRLFKRFRFVSISRSFSSKPTKFEKFPRVFAPSNSKPFTIDILQKRHREDLVKYIDEVFLPLDPMGYAIGHKELREKLDPLFLNHSRKWAEIYAEACLDSELPVSTVAFDYLGRFAGLGVGEVRRLPLGATKMVMEHSGEDDLLYTSPFFKDITRMVNVMNDEVNFASYLKPKRLEIARKRTPQEIVIADMAFLGTRADVRKNGLGSAIFQACFEQIISQDIDFIMIHSVNPFTTKECLAHGFKLVRSMEWPFGGLVPGRSVTWQNTLYSI